MTGGKYMYKKIKFGIIGAGRIAKKFAEGIKYAKEAELIGIASRNITKSNEFGDIFGIKKRYDNYEALAKDEEIDVVYISTPNGLHKDHAILCLKNKKAVICEKPFAGSKKDVEEMISIAKENNVFLMEAMWTRFFPLIRRIREILNEDIIGKVKMIKGDFGFKSSTGYDDIRFDKNLAGGAIMDVGVYPISFVSMIYNRQPKEIKVISDICHTGVDEQSSMIFGYENGEMALLSCAIMTETPKNIFIIGDKGYIHIPHGWYRAEKAFIQVHNKDQETIHMPMEGNGYNYEIEEVIRCLKEGKLESDIMPLKESLEIQQTLDTIRKQIGII